MDDLSTDIGIWVDLKKNIVHYGSLKLNLVGAEDTISIDDLCVLCYNLAKFGKKCIGDNNCVNL